MTELTQMTPDEVREVVRDHYAAAARAASTGETCCAGDDRAAARLYTALEREEVPDRAVLASLGCGNPIAVAELRPGERVLLSAKRVGPTGRAFGLDMTDEMLALAQSNAAEAGATNVEFLKGEIESIPLPGGSIDVVISNCVLNLAADKAAVFAEIARVLRPGGRVGVTDIVAEDRLSVADRATRGSYCGCIAGALSISEVEAGLAAAGLTNVSVSPTHAVADGMVSAVIRASKPAGADDAGDARGVRAPLPTRSTSTCCGGDCCGSARG
jgi:arsenite methyltransferase